MTDYRNHKTVDGDLLPALREAMGKLRESEDSADIVADIEALDAHLREHESSLDDLLHHWFTDRGGNLRKRANHTAKKAPNREVSEIVATGFAMLSWHTSGGSIDSLMIARFRVGATMYGYLESLTTLLALVVYGRSVAADRWARVLGR